MQAALKFSLALNAGLLTVVLFLLSRSGPAASPLATDSLPDQTQGLAEDVPVNDTTDSPLRQIPFQPSQTLLPDSETDGDSPGSTPPELQLAGTENPVPKSRRQVTTHSIEMPLIFQAIDTGAVQLDAGQLLALQDLRQQFLAALGETAQDPDSPAYAERWLKIQPEFNDLMRGMIGARAYQNYELATRQSADNREPAR